MASLHITRRSFLAGALSTTAAMIAPGLAWSRSSELLFPEGFLWGVAASAPETESRLGRGRSNWDVFIDNIGGSADGTTNKFNVEFETRYMDDLKLLQQAGVKSFRFSFAWPRIQPETPGAPNAQAMGYYDRLMDAMLEHGIEPIPTLFHWDMPLWAGDFLDRDVARKMGDYAELMARLVGDRTKTWLLFNEPGVIPILGYGAGMFAPGYQNLDYMGRALHHVNLAHAQAFKAVRANSSVGTKISSAFNMMYFDAPSGKQEDIDSIKLANAVWRDGTTMPAYGKGYPLILMPYVEKYIQPGDMEAIAIHPDFFGLNFYSRFFVKANPKAPLGHDIIEPPKDLERTQEMPYDPDTFYQVLMNTYKFYDEPEIIVTEFGFPLKDDAPSDGWVSDPKRIKFIKGYLESAHKAYQDGVNLKGMIYWSATDNWEWTQGLDKRFGLIHVEHPSLKRIPKRSLEYFGRCIKMNGIAREPEL